MARAPKSKPATAEARPTRAPKPRKAKPAAATERLDELCHLLAEAIRDAPRAVDFEGLAEHLYAFAAQAPKLAARMDGSATAIAEQIAGLARVAPGIVELIGEAMRVASSLATATTGLEQAAARLEAASRGAGEALPTPPSEKLVADLREALARVDTARTAIVDALDALPRAADYEPFAKQLREIASVSPSLMEWMGEVPRVAAPLRDSVERLWEAASVLKAAGAILDGCIAVAKEGS